MISDLPDRNAVKAAIIELDTLRGVNILWVRECKHHRDRFEQNEYILNRVINKLNKLVGWPLEI